MLVDRVPAAPPAGTDTVKATFPLLSPATTGPKKCGVGLMFRPAARICVPFMMTVLSEFAPVAVTPNAAVRAQVGGGPPVPTIGQSVAGANSTRNVQL